MRDFDFLEPAGIDDACRMLLDEPEESRLIAGGTALMLGMRQRMLSPARLVSIGHLEALRGIDFDAKQGLRIGALTRHAELAADPAVQAHYPMLASMAARVANPQVRNQGTLGGNLCYADPATDPPGCLMALDARVVIRGPEGERRLPIEDFLVDYYTTALAPGELITEIRLPPPTEGDRGHYARHLRTAAEHRPLVSVAAWVRPGDNGCAAARLVVGASTVVPTRVPRAEALLMDKPMSEATLTEAAELIAGDISPISDARGSAEYRREMVRVIARRSLAHLFALPLE